MAFTATFHNITDVIREVRNQGTELRGEPVTLQEATEFVGVRADIHEPGVSIDYMPTVNGVTYIGDYLFFKIIEDTQAAFIPTHVRVMKIMMEQMNMHKQCWSISSDARGNPDVFAGCSFDVDVIRALEDANIQMPESVLNNLKAMFPFG
jgi:hypothetical protein